MPTYSFIIENGFGITSDSATADYADAREARAEAVRYLGDLLKDHPRQFWASGVAALVVKDASDLVLFRVDVLATEAPAAPETPASPAR